MNIFHHLKLYFNKLLNKTSRTIVILQFLLLICFIFPIKAGENGILVHPVKTTIYDFYDKITVIGKCKSNKSRDYYAKYSGTVNSMSMNQGNNISAGDFLISIDKNIAEAKKAKSEAAFESAKTAYEKDLSLFKKKFISSELLAKSKVALKIAKLDLINSINQYNDMIVTAPYDGYIGVIKAKVGDEVKIGDYLFSLVAPDDKIIFLELPENMHSKIDQNSLIYARDINNNKIQGKIIDVSDYLNENGTMTAKIAFSSDSKLIHNSYIEVEIIFDEHKALAIPEKILLKNDKGNFVYKIIENDESELSEQDTKPKQNKQPKNNDQSEQIKTKQLKVKQVYVNVGSRTNDMIEIISDEIQDGDLLVLSGLTKIYNNANIRIIEEKNK